MHTFYPSHYFLALLFLASHAVSETMSETSQLHRPNDWRLTFYDGSLSADTLFDMGTFNASYDSDFRFQTMALAYRVTAQRDWTWELEGQIAKHYQGQHHEEFNALIVFRWHQFPWHEAVNTNIAAGAGLSYATDTPDFELEKNNGKSQQLLGYLMFELALALPRLPQWAIIARVHHRSGAYGLFGNDIRGASNALAFGLQYRF